MNFQPLSIINENTSVCRPAIMATNKILKWNCVKCFIVFLICSDIKLSSAQINFVDHIKDEIKSFTQIWFSGFIHFHHGDCGPCLRCVDLVKSCQDPRTFLGIVGGNSKGAFLCAVELIRHTTIAWSSFKVVMSAYL